MLALACSMTACGSASSDSKTTQSENSEESAQSESLTGRVVSIDGETITVMAFNGENRKGGPKPGETMDPNATMPADMEKTEGEPPEKMDPDVTMDPNATMSADMEKNGDRMQGEETTVLVSDRTSITKENEDGTTETASVSDLTEGSMIKVTGTITEDGWEADTIVVMQSMGEPGRNDDKENSNENM